MKPSEALAAHRVEVRAIVLAHRAVNARVFGCVLHGSDTGDSDLDILVDTTQDTTLFDLGAIRYKLRNPLGVPVDVLTPGALPEKFRQAVISEARLVRAEISFDLQTILSVGAHQRHQTRAWRHAGQQWGCRRGGANAKPRRRPTRWAASGKKRWWWPWLVARPCCRLMSMASKRRGRSQTGKKVSPMTPARFALNSALRSSSLHLLVMRW